MPSSISKVHSCLPGSLSTFSSNEDPVSRPPSKEKIPFSSMVRSSSPSKHSGSSLLMKHPLSSKSIFLYVSMVSTPMLIKKIGSVTVRLNGPIEALNSPSETVIVMAETDPRSSAGGIPDNKPEEELKLAHTGIPVILKVNISPSGSFAVG